MKRFTVLALAALLAAQTLPARATGAIVDIITDHDEARLAQFDAAKARALAEARPGGSAADLAVLEDLVARKHLPFADFDLTGNWQCRTIKVGGLATLVVYGWFRCRVTDDGAGWRLEKLSGSQRTEGAFYTESDTSLTYLGSYFVAGDPVPAYGKGPESDQVGRTFRTGSQTWQIEFPLPTYESTFDIIEFRR
jgi:hypothetical protein